MSFERTPCTRQVRYLKFKWKQQGWNPKPLSLQPDTQPFSQTDQIIIIIIFIIVFIFIIIITFIQYMKEVKNISHTKIDYLNLRWMFNPRKKYVPYFWTYSTYLTYVDIFKVILDFPLFENYTHYYMHYFLLFHTTL